VGGGSLLCDAASPSSREESRDAESIRDLQQRLGAGPLEVDSADDQFVQARAEHIFLTWKSIFERFRREGPMPRKLWIVIVARSIKIFYSTLARTGCAILIRPGVRHRRDQLVAPLITSVSRPSRGVNRAGVDKSAQGGFQVIPYRKKAVPDRKKAIHGHFPPIADHLNPIADGFYPIADRLKVIADGKKVIRVGFK
jgi:hypothetical protein